MDVISENIANMNTTRAADGKAYQRQHVVFEMLLNQAAENGSLSPSGIAVRVEKESRPPRMVYDPGHPDANTDGMVAMPDINIHEEMVDLISASRTFEANLAVLKNARTMALQTLAIGKRT